MLRFCTVLLLVFVFSVAALSAERLPWTTSRIIGSPDPPKEYHVQRVYPQLQFNQPVELMPLADTGKMMLLEVGGKLFTFDDQPDCKQADLAIDLKPLMDNFQRAYGFGIHPNFSVNRQIFIAYAGGPVARPDGTRLSRFVLSETDPPTIDPRSEEILLTWPSGGHNGCAIRFDSKGLLYFSAGDGARPYPPDEYNVSQDLMDLRSTICRIDVDRRDGEKAYAIPADNPFVDTVGARPEIWAYGFRNPWRFTIVPDTDQILCGDVGWELWELVFDVRRGGNYGWSIFEGPQPIRSDIKRGPTPISKPLVAYPHAVGQSITGGVVYRGDQLPHLRGTYLYGDYVTGLLWGLRQHDGEVTWNPVLAETGLTIITFAESRDREVLIVSYDGGIYQLVNNELAGKPSEFPRKLSETGLFATTETLEPAPGVIPYQISAAAYQGPVSKDFVVAIPDLATVKVGRLQRNWVYPVGTVFANTMSVDTNQDGTVRKKRVETQILHYDGMTWQPYSYLWNAEGTDADLIAAAGVNHVIDAIDQTQPMAWRVHNRAECRSCHSRQNGGAIGFSFANLGAQQVGSLVDIDVLNTKPQKPWQVTYMVNPADESAALDHRARSYLTANCGHCHIRGGGGTVPLDLTYNNTIEKINAIDVAATQGTFGIRDAKVIFGGDPYRSVLFYRMATGGLGHMPKLWTRENDVAGLKLIHDWIRSLPTGDHIASVASPVIPEAFDDTAESLRLLSELMLDDQQQELRLPVAQAAAEHGNLLTSSLFERYLPNELRRQRLGENIDAKSILGIKGDAQRGRERFFDSRFQQCIGCHRLQGGGQSVGPDLDGIAKQRTREQLLQSILDPSKEIDPKYSNHSVLNADGDVVTGLKVLDEPDSLVIRSAAGKDHRIARSEIESLSIQKKSLMPAGLAAEMTAQELADLIAFLASLR